MTPSHSYYPLGVEIPHYAPNGWSTLTLLAIFAVACILVFAVTISVATRTNPHISNRELSKVFWFALCGSIHFILEGYYAANFSDLAGKHTVLAQLWKEYSKSDSRYLTNNSFVMCMETVTAVCWGPLSFLLAYFITSGNPFRHPLQLIISLGQLYGNVLYYGTCAFEFLVHGVEFSRPETYYFYGYFVFLNAFWIVIPLLLIFDSVRATGKAFAEVKRVGTVTNGTNGLLKKSL
ncbi:EXPERA domain-containing protein [Aspergillus lucknowensis]|uniref:3-beta-hydroxysteroid-Delta(8), Delta(7)-isomerase n=1 Tax=Aspergillus lucknowensis TaxID=176173 RepID=A0ABR4M1N3_9EURO